MNAIDPSDAMQSPPESTRRPRATHALDLEARLTLEGAGRAGEGAGSPPQMTTFASGCPAAAFGVGANGQWRIEGPGIAPLHIFLRFSGVTLHACSAQGVEPARVNGAPLPARWVALPEPCEIAFGAARLTLRRAPSPIERVEGAVVPAAAVAPVASPSAPAPWPPAKSPARAEPAAIHLRPWPAAQPPAATADLRARYATTMAIEFPDAMQRLDAGPGWVEAAYPAAPAPSSDGRLQPARAAWGGRTVTTARAPRRRWIVLAASAAVGLLLGSAAAIRLRHSLPRNLPSAAPVALATSGTGHAPAADAAPAAAAQGGTSPGGSAAPSRDGSARTLERAAIDAVAQGDFSSAADLYGRLAQANPGAPVYADAERIARRKARSK